MSDEEVMLLAASGVNHIGFGTESASPEVLRRMNKAHQQIPDMFEAARKSVSKQEFAPPSTSSSATPANEARIVRKTGCDWGKFWRTL